MHGSMHGLVCMAWCTGEVGNGLDGDGEEVAGVVSCEMGNYNI